MSRSTKVVIASAAAGALALGVGIGIAGFASADPTASPSASPTSSASADQSRGGGRGDRRGGPGRGIDNAELAKQLAEKLGVDEAKVLKALEEIQAAQDAERAAALTTKLDEAVKAGTLTQAEADAVKKAAEKGVISGR